MPTNMTFLLFVSLNEFLIHRFQLTLQNKKWSERILETMKSTKNDMLVNLIMYIKNNYTVFF